MASTPPSDQGSGFTLPRRFHPLPYPYVAGIGCLRSGSVIRERWVGVKMIRGDPGWGDGGGRTGRDTGSELREICGRAGGDAMAAVPGFSRLINWGNRDRRERNANVAAWVNVHGNGALRRRQGDAVADGGMVVDSAMDFEKAVAGTAAPREVLENLGLIDVRYRGFDGRLHIGQLVCQLELAAEIGEIFTLLEQWRFPIAGVVPIVRYGWSDGASMDADNSSAFNYRTIAGTDRLSRHALGRAVDINPRENPAVYPDGRIAPAEAVYRPGNPGTFTEDHPAVCAFIERGWRWGGHFDHMRDYHHFEK